MRMRTTNAKLQVVVCMRAICHPAPEKRRLPQCNDVMYEYFMYTEFVVSKNDVCV